jgi:N-acetylneuraminic acid mutarotase
MLVLFFLTVPCVMVAKPASSSSNVAGDSWASKAPMHQARGGLGVAVVNGKIYAIGGSTASGLYPPSLNGGFVGTNEEYDPATDTWTTKAPMPTPRAYFAIAAYQNKIYCIGGTIGIGQSTYDGTSIPTPTYMLSGVNEIYDPATDTWENKAPMPTARMQIHANIVDDKIYIMDGFDRIVAPNEVYNPETAVWSTKTPMPTAGSDHVSAVIDNKVYVIVNDIYTIDEKNSRRLFIYNPDSDSWSQGTPAPLIVVDGSAGATTGVNAPKRIYVLGVEVGSSSPPVNYAYDPENDSWRASATIPTNRLDFCAAVVDDKLYAIGGYTLDNTPNNGKVTVSAVNEQYTPFGYGTVPPVVTVVSPKNGNYTSSNVLLTFTVNKPVVWMGISLDGQETAAVAGNTTLSALSIGFHNVTVYAKDEFGNTGTSETVNFTIAKPEPFPTALVATVSGVSAAIIGVGLLAYFKKRKR